jgi:hypothetical protein
MSGFTHCLTRLDADGDEINTPLVIIYRWFPFRPATLLEPAEPASVEFGHSPPIDLTDDEIAEIEAACANHAADERLNAEERAADNAREWAWMERLR